MNGSMNPSVAKASTGQGGSERRSGAANAGMCRMGDR